MGKLVDSTCDLFNNVFMSPHKVVIYRIVKHVLHWNELRRIGTMRSCGFALVTMLMSGLASAQDDMQYNWAGNTGGRGTGYDIAVDDDGFVYVVGSFSD